MKKRISNLFVCLAVLALLSGCMLLNGPDGKSNQRFIWVESLSYIYDENPSTPYTIRNAEYFPTDDGTFYMEYQTVNDSGWWAYYKITTESGTPFFERGDTSWFSICLYSSGPEFYKATSPANRLGLSSPTSKTLQRAQASLGKARGPIEGTRDLTLNGRTIHLEYGRLK